jgi:amidase
MNTTGGSYALINTVVNDAPAVKKLRDAGALILGKANLSQWGTSLSQRSRPSLSWNLSILAVFELPPERMDICRFA